VAEQQRRGDRADAAGDRREGARDLGDGRVDVADQAARRGVRAARPADDEQQTVEDSMFRLCSVRFGKIAAELSAQMSIEFLSSKDLPAPAGPMTTDRLSARIRA
jgi:hypothetical protein